MKVPIERYCVAFQSDSAAERSWWNVIDQIDPEHPYIVARYNTEADAGAGRAILNAGEWRSYMKLNPRGEGPGTVVGAESVWKAREQVWKARQLVIICDEAQWPRADTARKYRVVAESYAIEGNHEAAKLFNIAALEAERGW